MKHHALIESVIEKLVSSELPPTIQECLINLVHDLPVATLNEMLEILSALVDTRGEYEKWKTYLHSALESIESMVQRALIQESEKIVRELEEELRQ